MGRRAIIAGAGVGGLSTALALSQAGFEVTLYERADRLEEFGAGLQLTPNATRILARLGVLEDVRSVATVPDSVRVLRGSDDRELVRLPLDDAERRWRAPYLAIHRADLQTALAEAARRQANVVLRLGATFAGLATEGDQVSVGLKRGEIAISDRADLLIGADGLRSRVRERLGLGEAAEPEFTGRVAFRATIEAGRADPRWLRPAVVLRLGPRAHLVHYPLRGGSIVNVVAIIEQASRGAADDHPWDGAADRPALDRAFARWSAETRGIIEAAANWRAWPLYSRPPIASFSIGRVALVGDAAHPMVPFLAQGAAQAIEDAGAFSRIFAEALDIPAGLAAFSRERITRAARVQAEALTQGRIYHLSGPMALARDTTMRLLGPRRLSARYDWLYSA